MFLCCCAKPRKDGEEESIEDQNSKLKNVNRILIEFVQEESRLGLKDVPCIEMIEKILLASNKGEIPKKEIIQIYKSTDSINQNVIKNFLMQEFFFTDNTRQKYDFNKMVLFNLLYSGGKELEKSNFLFNVLENTSSSCVHNHSQKLSSTVEYLTAIPCLVVGETLNSARRFQSEQDDQEFQELLSLYSTNSHMIKEFAIHIISMHLFPSSEEKQYLMRQDFLKKMEDCNYVLIKPHELRKKYTDYVWQNKARALLPSQVLRRTKHREDDKRNSEMSGSNERRSALGSGVNITRNSAIRNSQMHQQQPRYSQSKNNRKQRQSIIEQNNRKPVNNNNEGEQDLMNKTISDRSMILYRYEDKSQRPTDSSRNGKKSNKQQRISIQGKDEDMSPIQSPGGKHLERLSESEIQRQLQNMNLNKQLNQSLVRESNETTTSFSNHNFKKYPSVQVYLKEMFGEQFVSFVQDLQAPFDTKRQERLQKNLEDLKSGNKTLTFPDFNSYPYHVREVFEYFKALINKDDLIAFAEGSLYKETIINVYLKILEKANLVLQSSYNYHKAITRQSVDQFSHLAQPQKILYFNSNFSRRLNNQAFLKDCINQLKDFFKYDIVILPFFFDQENDQRALIVAIRVATSTVDLYDREREEDNHDISDTVLHMMDLASHIVEGEFNEDQIDGGVEGVCVGRDEDMLVAVCHIAESITLNRPVDMEIFNLKQERQRVLDVFLTLLNFN